MTNKSWLFTFTILFLAALIVWIGALNRPTQKLKVIACDVGQGDAYLITLGNFQALIDGGPNNKVLDCLGRYVSFFDRDIEIVIQTHPDADHYTGLVEVLKRYNVKHLVYSEARKDNDAYSEFLDAANAEGANRVVAVSGKKIVYGDLHFEIVSPINSMFVAGEEIDEDESNDYSVVTHLVYGDFSALFTGDLTPKVTQKLVSLNQIPDVDYLSVPHHGSKNGLTQILLQKTTPNVTVISVGLKNRYGHPHEDVLKLLDGYKYFRTDQVGEVVLQGDGKIWDIY